MSRASNSEKNRRINFAISLLAKNVSCSEATTQLRDRFGISLRQASRYVQEATNTTEQLPIPEEKIVFTIKLPVSLVSRVRKFSKETGKSISDITSQALEYILGGG